MMGNKAIDELNNNVNPVADLRQELGSISSRIERQLQKAILEGRNIDAAQYEAAAFKIGGALSVLKEIK